MVAHARPQPPTVVHHTGAFARVYVVYDRQIDWPYFRAALYHVYADSAVSQGTGRSYKKLTGLRKWLDGNPDDGSGIIEAWVLS